MPQTVIRGTQILNGSVQRADMNTGTAGQAVITKVIGGSGITLASTGMDSGTGDVTVSASAFQGFISKTAAYTLTSADSGKYFICSGGSWTLTLPAPAAGLTYQIRNDMGIAAGSTTGTITISPTGGTIDGASSLALLPQQECTLITDGTNWRSLGLKREVILGTLDITSATASATVLLPAGYRLFVLDLAALVTSVDGVTVNLTFSSDGGSTFIAVNYYDQYHYNSAKTTIAAGGDYNVAVGLVGQASSGLGGQTQLKIYPGSSAQRASWISQSEYYYTPTSFLQLLSIGGFLAPSTLTIMNAVKIAPASGTINNMFMTVKGVV